MPSFSFLKSWAEKFFGFARTLKTGVKQISYFLIKKVSFFWVKFGWVKKNDLAQHDQILVSSLSTKRWPHVKQFKYLPQVVSKNELWVLRLASLVFVLAVIGLLINGYFVWTKMVPAYSGVYVEGLVGAPKLINPLYAPLNDVDQDLSSLIYAGLVKLDRNRQLVPELAESWQVSSDQKEYTFILRESQKWQDGEEITTDDVVFTVQAIQDPEFKSPLYVNFVDVKTEVIDKRTIKFILKNSFTTFLENLTVGILPVHLWQDVVPANALMADYNLKPIGAGPYQFKSLVKDKLGSIKSYTLESNSNYLPHQPYLKEITFKFYPDFETAVAALKNHNIEGLSYLPPDLKSEVEWRTDLQFNILGLPQYTGLFFNQKNNVALKDLKVRQALAYAINKPEIVAQALKGSGEVIDAPILAGFVGYNSNIVKYDFDLIKARQFLDEAGWKVVTENNATGTTTLEVNNSGVRQKDKQELKIVLTTVNRPENFRAGQLIQKYWHDIGVKTELKVVEAGQIQGDVIRERNFEVLLFGEIFGFDPDPYPFWHSSQSTANGLNLANFNNKDADRVLEEARQTADLKARNDKYIYFQNILNAELPAIFLFTPKYIYPVANKIKAVGNLNIASPADRFANIEDWYINTKRSFK